MSTRTPPRRRLAGQVAALELSVVAVMAAAAFGFLRIFDTAAVLRPLLVAVVASEALAAAGRRLRLPTAVTAIASVAALVVVVSNWLAPGTTSRLLPTRATWPALATAADAGLQAAAELRAPVPPLEPLVAAAFLGLWLGTLLADWGVVRLRLAVEPLLPAAGLFLLCSVLGSGQHRVASAAAFGAAIALYAVVRRGVDQAQRTTWLPVERARGLRSTAVGGLALGALALAGGLVLGPRLPGAGSGELWSWRDTGPGTRVVVSPFVTIESRLAEQADTELFRVTAEEPSYWRTAGLDVYEDGVWQIRGDFSRESGRLPGREPVAGTVAVVRQTFHLTGLAEIWLPAAYAPARIFDADGPVTWNDDTSTLSVDRDRAESTGASYSVESVVPRYTVEELRSASWEVPSDIAEDFLALPGDLTPRVQELAREVTVGQPTRYDQLRALQDWFLTQFTYDASLPPREGDPVEQFLEERAGFCQQFAGTFAVMARALGAPARVAVGFTWGDQLPEDPTTFVVTGRHAHAWPEVWFEGLGWVPFEPTPGRGAPGAEAWTGIPAQQEGEPAVDATGDELAGAPADLEPAPLPAPGFDDALAADLAQGLLVEGSTDPASGGGDDAGGAPVPLLGALGVAGAWLLGVPLADAALRVRRRSRTRTAADRVEDAWLRALDQLELLGLRRAPSETRLEFCQRLAADRRLRAEPPRRLAQLATTARWAPTALDERAVGEAEAELRRVTELVHGRVPAWRRYLRQVDPRRRVRLPRR